jgi:glutamate synthase domain-containing protein 3
VVEPWPEDHLHRTRDQDHGLSKALDRSLIEECRSAIDTGEPLHLRTPIQNVNRTVGTMLGHEVTKAHGAAGLPDDTIVIDLDGSAGNSFGAFVPRGITLRLFGDANDYVGKGLSGGKIVVRPPRDCHPEFVAEKNIIAGNVIAYGATSGELYLRGAVGERFCVRNSGAVAVVEGVGDHGCEYMTGGRVVVLGSTGRNFGAGMSGGIAYVYDADGEFPTRVNFEMVDLEELDDTDRQLLQRCITAHLDQTDSPVARSLLADWDDSLVRFRKVMPNDYRRVLEATARAEAEGLDVVEAIMAASQR